MRAVAVKVIEAEPAGFWVENLLQLVSEPGFARAASASYGDENWNSPPKSPRGRNDAVWFGGFGSGDVSRH